MLINSSGLERFRLDGRLGEGAELEAFAATDTETGQPVVVKRPHPTLISRSQHGSIEQRLERVISLRERLGNALPKVARLIAHTSPEPHDGYFGDALGSGYTVIIEERARGIPLVGSTLDGIRRKPIGLPQNLFVLHPLVPHTQKGPSIVAREVLEVAWAFNEANVLLLDLRPQNVFFDPKKAAITVIDVSSIADERSETRRHAALDWHDFYLEIFKWYATPSSPPATLAAYGSPHGTDSVTMFRQDVERMLHDYSAISHEPLGPAAVDMLQKVRQRDYGGFEEFRREFEEFLSLTEDRYRELSENASVVGTWVQAAKQLQDPYWRKFLFDPDVDLTSYSAYWSAC